MKALKGTAIEPEVVLVLPEPPPAAVRELGALALCEAAEVPVVERMRTPVLPDSAAVELIADRALLVDRLSTPPEVAERDEPLLLEVGLRSALPEAAVAPAPAPDDEPAVLDATTAGVPLWEAWI